MYKVPVIIKDDYIVLFEPAPVGVLLHCDVMKWNKEVRKSLQRDFLTLQELHGYRQMFAVHKEHQDEKHIKFLRLMGFSYLKDLTQGGELWSINHMEV